MAVSQSYASKTSEIHAAESDIFIGKICKTQVI